MNATIVGTGTSGGVSPVTSGNFINYDYGAAWNGEMGIMTTVGTNGGASAYGTFDMSGNLVEINNLTGAADDFCGYRGGGWDNDPNTTSSLSAFSSSPDFAYRENDGFGFRLASVAVPEPSTCAMALAGLACGGYLVRRRRKRA